MRGDHRSPATRFDLPEKTSGIRVVDMSPDRIGHNNVGV